MFGLLYEFPTITPVGIDASYPWRNNGKHCRESVCGFGIMDIGWGVEVFGMLPSFFCYHVVFHVLGFVVSVNDFWETRQSGTATLAVDGSYCGVW